MSDVAIQALVTIVSTFFGYGVVAARLRGKLDVVIYQSGAKGLWDETKKQRDDIVEMRTENRLLKEQNAELRAEMRSIGVRVAAIEQVR